MKKLLVLSFAILSYYQANATSISPVDSVGVEKVGDKTFIIHEVGQGETLFGLSRRYEVAVNDILQNNSSLQEGLKMGQRVRVPYVAKETLPEGATLHKVVPGETLFSISQRYNASVSEVMAWNKLKGNDLSVGQALIIKNQKVAEVKPVETPAASPQPASGTNPSVTVPPVTTPSKETAKASPPAVEKPKEEAKVEVKKEVPTAAPTPAASTASPNTSKALPGDWITHTVEQGETLFSIAKKYEARIDDVISWNALSSNNLATGQKLKVGREPAESSNVPVVSSSVPIVVNNEKKEGELVSNDTEEESTAYKNVKQTGLAEVIEGTGNHKKYLVLHRDAPVGTIMRVRNEENDQTIFARVVGKLPDTGDNNRLVIKLSKAAYDQLRAVNSRFPVEISF